MTSPSMVQRSGDTLVIRSLVSGDQLFVNDSGTESYVEDTDYNNDVIGEDNKNLPQCKIRRNYSCSNCNYFTQNPRHFLYHLRDVHQEKVKIYECPNCLYASKHFQKLLRHMKMVHGSYDNLEFCETTKIKSHKKKKHSEVVNFRKTNSESKEEFEPPDKKSRQDVTQLDDTMGKLSSELKCSLCPFTTRHQGQLTRHEKQEHIKTKFFRCSKCSYVTHIKARFTKHVKYHSMPMIKCDLCDFRTPYKWNLDRHYKNHNGHGSFRCSACNFTADIKQSLTVHEMNHHVPPVGQAAGLGVGRRRNKVGASDTTAAEDEEQEKEQRQERERAHEIPKEFIQTSTPKQNEEKTNANLKISIKKTKNLQQNERHNFYMDFIHSDDIIHHANGNIYIKKKCKYCNFKTAWDTEMTKHEWKIHNIGNNITKISSNAAPKKAPRPIPNLIPIQYSPPNHNGPITANTHSNQNIYETGENSPNIMNLNDIKELSTKAGFSSLHDFISLFGDDDCENKNIATENSFSNSKTDLLVNSACSDNNSSVTQPAEKAKNIDLERKHTSFFDKLKAKLMTSAGESCNLTCKWCGHESKCLSELAGHQKSCGKESNSSTLPSKVFNVSSTRCQYCRQRCKSSIDLLNHFQSCPNIDQVQKECSIDIKSESSETKDEVLNNESQEPHPMENVVFVWNNISQTTDMEVNNCYEEKHEVEDAIMSDSISVRVPTPESEISVDTVPVNHNVSKMPTHGNDLDQVSEGKRVFKCPHCSFWASTASRFHVHIVGHLNKKPFECSLCAYRSNWRWDITKHIRLKSVRDSAHTKAKVLMTDETGRRNYSKYNKYLTQMKTNKSQHVEKDKTNYEMSQGQMSPSQTMPGLPNLVRATSLSNMKSQNPINLLRPPPPLKPAYAAFYNNEENKKKIEADIKKTLFKCKKCNFRDANRENMLVHVKGHYRQEGNTQISYENNGETDLDDERHCRLKHSGDVRVVIGGKNGTPEKIEADEPMEADYYNVKHEEFFKCIHCPYLAKNIEEIEGHIDTHLTKQENELKCCFCPFFAVQKFELYEHLKLHGVSDPEDYINKSLPDTSLFSENSLIYIRRYKCMACPYICDSKQQFLSHKQFHRPRGAPYKCKFCSYNVSRTHLLQQHMRLHGSVISVSSHNDASLNIKTEDLGQVSDANLQMETQTFKDIPLVWVSKDNKFSKMFKCRYCPHLNLRKTNIQEHEKMHSEHGENGENMPVSYDVMYSCPSCSYVCNNAGVLSAHGKVHQGGNGQIHCLVDLNKTDEEQITELTNLLNKSYQNPDKSYITMEEFIEDMEVDGNIDYDIEKDSVTKEIADMQPEKMLFFCQHCPARYLYEKELETHNRFHGSRLFYRCDYCSYTARQRPHLLAHYSVHSHEYNHETKMLQHEYIVSKNHSAPNISIVKGANINNEPVWTVTQDDVSLNIHSGKSNEMSPIGKYANKKFACSKCPTKFYNSELLAYHMTLHGGKHPYKCHVCDYSAITRNNLEKHERIHGKWNADSSTIETSPIQISIGNVSLTPGTRLYQEILNARDTNEKMLINDSEIIMQDKNPFYSQLQFKTKGFKSKKYRCTKCPCTFEKREQFKVHLSLHGSKQRYQCDKCDYSVKYYANFVQHIRKHDVANSQNSNEVLSDNINNCDIMKDVMIEDIDEISDDDKSCKLAVKSVQSSKPGALKLSLSDRQTLMILQEIRNNNVLKDTINDDKKMYWCPHCPYTSHRRDAVDNHINRHICVSGIRNNYTCEHCDYTVPQSHFLREHTKIHFSSFKFHQPEAFMVSKCMKLLYEKYRDDKNCIELEDQDENILFYDTGETENQDQYKPSLNSDLLKNSHNSDVKIFINLNTQEVVENYVPTSANNTKTKDE